MTKFIFKLVLMVPLIPAMWIDHACGCKRDAPNNYNSYWQSYKFNVWTYYRQWKSRR